MNKKCRTYSYEIQVKQIFNEHEGSFFLDKVSIPHSLIWIMIYLIDKKNIVYLKKNGMVKILSLIKFMFLFHMTTYEIEK